MIKKNLHLHLLAAGIQESFEGIVLVNDQNLKTNYEDVVDDIGICPQENIFFLDMNIFEQLFFYGMVYITYFIQYNMQNFNPLTKFLCNSK